MSTVKKGDSSINVVFKDGAYTNKLSARNITIEPTKNGDSLNIDYSHYSKRKRGNLEDSDFERLEKTSTSISHIQISDETVSKAIEKADINEVNIKLTESTSVTVPVSNFDLASGLLK